MNDYYIKITQRDAQIEFSTSDKAEFGLRLAELMRLAGALEREPQVVDSLLEQKKSTQDIDVASKLLETKQQTTKNKIEHSSDTTKTTQDNKNAFENILKKEMKNPQEQVSPNFGLDKKYATILAAKDISGDLDSLIFTAGYLILYEKLSSFTLKDIKPKFGFGYSVKCSPENFKKYVKVKVPLDEEENISIEKQKEVIEILQKREQLLNDIEKYTERLKKVKEYVKFLGIDF